MNVSYAWDVDPNQFLTSVNASIADITLEVTEAIFDGVVERSPVWTGSFRRSWNVSVGTPDFTVTNGGSPGAPLTPPKFPRIRATPGDILYVSNGQPYGPKLENGSSSQAPLGMVAATLASL